MLAIPPLAAEPIFYLSRFPVTNSYINSTLALLGFVIFVVFLNKGIKKYYKDTDNLSSPSGHLSSSASAKATADFQKGEMAPKGLLNFFEGIVEFVIGYIDQVTHDRKKSLKILPIVGTLFLFILVSNWMGLLPGVGSIGIYEVKEGVVELVPLLRPANTDLNMTLSMAVFAVITSHLLGIIAIGFFKYANKFIKLGDLYQAFKSLKPVNILTAVVEFFVGLIEIFSEVAKMVSLSLRLFGNIFAGEVLMTVLAGLIPVLVPLPFMALELLVGFIQAVVFSMLALVYISMATTEVHGHGDDEHKKDHEEEAKAVA